MKAYKEIETVKQIYIEMQENVETIFHTIYLQATCFEDHLLVEPFMLRTATRQMYCNNP